MVLGWGLAMQKPPVMEAQKYRARGSSLLEGWHGHPGMGGDEGV